MKSYDFWLVMIAIALLVAMGLLAFGGTLWTWRAELAQPGWSAGPGNVAYVDLMNKLVAPLVAGLVVVLGLCMPRRLFDRRTLGVVSAAMVLVGVFFAVVGGAAAGIAVFLLAAGALQGMALVLTLTGSGAVNYLKENVIYQVGSTLLHLGFVVLVFDWAVIGIGPLHLTVFWIGSALLVVGTGLCFYREEIGRLAGRLRGAGGRTNAADG